MKESTLLLEKEYLNLLKTVVNHFDYIEDELDIAGKKGLLKLVFKGMIIENGRIKSFELFEPFKSFYEGAEIKWEMQELRENQWVATEKASVSQLLPSADRWFVLYKLSKPFFFTAFQVELAAM